MNRTVQIIKVVCVAIIMATCSGCIAAACIGIAAIAVAAGASASKTNWVWCCVDSGRVGANVQLKNRYVIMASKIWSSSPKKYRYDDSLTHWASPDGSGVCVEEIKAMYPDVFAHGEGVIPIEVELELKDAGESNYHPSFVVKVRDAGNGRELGRDGFSIASLSQKQMPEAAASAQGCEQNVSWDAAHPRLIAQGYAGAIVAALATFENEGQYRVLDGEPPPYREPIAAVQSSVEQVNDQEAQYDNTVEAVNLFMGSMNAINSMNQAQRARHAASVQRRAAALNTRQTLRTSSSAEMQVLSAAAAKDAKASIPKFQKPVFKCSIHGETYQAGQHCPKCMAPDFGL